MVDFFISVDTFEQQCAVLKGMLQSNRLKDNMKTIGIDLSLSNNALLEHRCLQNIKKLCKKFGKRDNQQQFKDILEAIIVSTPELFNDSSTRSPMDPTPYNKPSARNALCLFTSLLDVKKKTNICQVGSPRSKRKSIKAVNTPWAIITKRKLNS